MSWVLRCPSPGVKYRAYDFSLICGVAFCPSPECGRTVPTWGIVLPNGNMGGSDTWHPAGHPLLMTVPEAIDMAAAMVISRQKHHGAAQYPLDWDWHEAPASFPAYPNHLVNLCVHCGMELREGDLLGPCPVGLPAALTSQDLDGLTIRTINHPIEINATAIDIHAWPLWGQLKRVKPTP